MKKLLKSALTYLILPLIVILIIFGYNKLLGVTSILMYTGYLFFKARASIFRFIGNTKYMTGDLSGGLKWFERAYFTGKANPRTITSYAYLLLKTGNIDKSEKVLNKLLGSSLSHDDKMYAKSNLALAIWKRGNLDEAIEIMESIIQNYKTSTVYGTLGYFLILKGDIERALQFNLEAYDYNNSNTVILDNLGQTYYQIGDYEKATEIFEKLMSLNPPFPEAYYNYGLVLDKIGQKEKALELIKKSLNYKISFISTVSKEDIETAIKQLESEVPIPTEDQ